MVQAMTTMTVSRPCSAGSSTTTGGTGSLQLQPNRSQITALT
jgi:hypothetical protein